MIYGPSTELAEELLCAEVLEVGDEERPQVQHVVTREPVSLLHDNGPPSEERHLYGSPQTTGPGAYNQDLENRNYNKCKKKLKIRKEGNVLFNDTLNTFYLRLYGVRHMVKDHSDSERGNLLLPHGLLFSINSKGSFICTIPQTG